VVLCSTCRIFSTFDLFKVRHTLSDETSVTAYRATWLHITEEIVAYLYVCGNTQTRVTAGILVLILQLTECYNSNRQCHCTCEVHWRAFWYQSKVRSSMSKNQVCAVENYVKREAFILITRQKYHYSVRSGRLY